MMLDRVFAFYYYGESSRGELGLVDWAGAAQRSFGTVLLVTKKKFKERPTGHKRSLANLRELGEQYSYHLRESNYSKVVHPLATPGVFETKGECNQGQEVYRRTIFRSTNFWEILSLGREQRGGIQRGRGDYIRIKETPRRKRRGPATRNSSIGDRLSFRALKNTGDEKERSDEIARAGEGQSRCCGGVRQERGGDVVDREGSYLGTEVTLRGAKQKIQGAQESGGFGATIGAD